MNKPEQTDVKLLLSMCDSQSREDLKLIYVYRLDGRCHTFKEKGRTDRRKVAVRVTCRADWSKTLPWLFQCNVQIEVVKHFKNKPERADENLSLSM